MGSQTSSFALSDEPRAMRDQARRFFMDELHPLERKMDEEAWWPDDMFARLGAMGYLGMTIPVEHGGSGLDYLTAGLILEAMAEANPSVAWSAIAHGNLCLDNIYRNATEAQRATFVPDLCSGRRVGGIAMTEPEAGSDAIGSMRTRAVRDGEHFYITGTKTFISNATIADVLLLYAKTEPGDGSRGVTAFIFETDTPGFCVARKLDKMGWRGSPIAEIVFDNAKVAVANVLGEPGRGVGVMMSGLDVERVMVAPLSLGTAERALRLSIEYAKSRRQFGQAIAGFQLIQAKLAHMFMRLEAARSLVYRALSQCDAMSDLKEAGRGEIHMLCAAAVHEAARAASFIMDEAAQIHGGNSYMRDTEINRLYRTAKVMEIAAGTQEIRQLIVAQELLRD
ncbi:MAG: acyl-CoA dehydrogenase family protein [Pseudomonadota bacterium]